MTLEWPQIIAGAVAGISGLTVTMRLLERSWQKAEAEEQKAKEEQRKVETEFKQSVRSSLNSIDGKLDEFGRRIDALQSEAEHARKDVSARLIQIDERHSQHVVRWQKDHDRQRIIELLVTRIGIKTDVDVTELLEV